MVFFPANTIFALQHFDQGMIQALSVSDHVEHGGTADTSTLAKSIIVLYACHFIPQSMKEIKRSTLSKCFQKAGFLNLTALRDKPDSQPPQDTLKETLRHAQLEILIELSAEEYCYTGK